TVESIAGEIGLKLGRRIDECEDHFKSLQCCNNCADEPSQRTAVSGVRVKFEDSKLKVALESGSDGGESVERSLTPSPEEIEPLTTFWSENSKAVLTGVCAVSLLLGVTLHGIEGAPHWVSTAAYVISYVAGGWYAGQLAFLDLLKGRLNVDFLMVAAAMGAAAVDRWQEGAILMFLFSLSGTLESYAMRRTRQAIRALIKIRPNEALVRRDRREYSVRVEDLRVGDTVIVKPGEAISADGEIALGDSYLQQSAITGESVPVHKCIGDSVFAGTLNERGALEIRVTKTFADTTLNRIIQMVEDAQSQKALPQRFSDWFGKYYTWAVMIGSVAYMLALMGTGMPWKDTFYRSMVLLVAASPCALVMATPSAILSAIATAARRGILMKGGIALETLGRVRVIAIDKTGTLTANRAQVTDVIPATGISEDELLALAAAAESRADHPLAEAVMLAARRRGLAWDEPSALEAISGMGVRATLDGRDLWVGNDILFRQAGIEISGDWMRRLDALRSQGKSYMILGDGRVLGLIGVADVIRPTAKEAIQRLKAKGMRTVMLTGDNPQVAETICGALGMDECRANLLPDDKLRIVKELRAKYGEIAMVGDGVNDAPALASATVGVAMGGAGTDVALETADVVLMSDDLNKLVEAVDLSRQGVRVLKQNWYFALTVVLALVATALLGQIALPVAVVGHEGNTLIVVLSGLRLLFYRPKAE
ncbi:MAG: heavy metal translocating P-type ATPase, partial [bacterium]